MKNINFPWTLFIKQSYKYTLRAYNMYYNDIIKQRI